MREVADTGVLGKVINVWVALKHSGRSGESLGLVEGLETAVSSKTKAVGQTREKRVRYGV